MHALSIGLAASALSAASCVARTSRCCSMSAVPGLLAEATAQLAERGVELRLGSTATPGSRTSSRIAVRAGPDGAAMVGMFKAGTHEVVPCEADERCYLPHHPLINAAVAAVAGELRASAELSAYDESSLRGTLRYLQLSVERSSDTVQLTLVANAPSLAADPALAQFALRLWRLRAPRWHSIWVNLNPTSVNNILSYEPDAWQLLHARDPRGLGGGAGDGDRDAGRDGCLVERFPSGAAFVLPPWVFRQANPYAFDAIVGALRRAVPAGSRVVEWYAGVGVLGLSLAPSVAWVRCSDLNPPYAAFEASRDLLPKGERARVTYAVGGAAERLDDARGADVAVVDPPRKGLDDALLAALCDARADGPCASLGTLAYISCGFPALVRDADALLASGWRVRRQRAEAHVLFLGANHLETLCVFERVAPVGPDGAKQDAQEPPRSSANSERGQRARRARDPATSPRARRLAAARAAGRRRRPSG